MPETLIIADNFNSYANNSAFSAVWSGGIGGVILQSGSSLTSDASPDASQYVGHGASGGGDRDGAPTTWGNDPAYVARTFTGLTPNGSFRVRWKMDIGHSSTSGIGSFPAAHTFTSGLQANDVRFLIGVNDQHGPEGLREDPGFPADVALVYAYSGVDGGAPAGSDLCRIFGLCGWIDYSLLTTADASGHITVTIGKFDGRNFQSQTYFEDIQIWEITTDVVPSTKQKQRPQVFGVGR